MAQIAIDNVGAGLIALLVLAVAAPESAYNISGVTSYLGSVQQGTIKLIVVAILGFLAADSALGLNLVRNADTSLLGAIVKIKL